MEASGGVRDDPPSEEELSPRLPEGIPLGEEEGEGEASMERAMLDMIEQDEEKEEAEERRLNRSDIPDQRVADRSEVSSEEDDEDGEDVQQIDVVVRLVMLAARAGVPLDPSLAEDVQVMLGPELYRDIIFNASPLSERSRRDQQRRLFDPEGGDMSPLSDALAQLQFPRSNGGVVNEDDVQLQLQDGVRSARARARFEEDDDEEDEEVTTPLAARARIRVSGTPPRTRTRTPTHTHAHAQTHTPTHTHECVHEDEWDDDNDPGYVAVPVSEEEFFAMEEEAMAAAKREFVSLHMAHTHAHPHTPTDTHAHAHTHGGLEWNSSSVSDEDSTYVLDALLEQDLQEAHARLLQEREDAQTQTHTPHTGTHTHTPHTEDGIHTGVLEGVCVSPHTHTHTHAGLPIDENEVAVADEMGGCVTVDESVSSGAPVPPRLTGGGRRAADAAGDTSLVNVEAPVWPRHADDFAFSQAGDEDEDQSTFAKDSSVIGNSVAFEGRSLTDNASTTSDAHTQTHTDADPHTHTHLCVEGEGDGVSDDVLCTHAHTHAHTHVDTPQVREDGDVHTHAHARTHTHAHTHAHNRLLSVAHIGEERTQDDGVAHRGDEEDGSEDDAEPEELESFNLKVIYERNRTGFEDTKEFNPEKGMVVAGRYRVTDFLGSAVFSSAVSAVDLQVEDEQAPEAHVCLKIIKNNKDFLDQSLDEIKLLHLLNQSGDADTQHLLRMYDYFYYKEHLFIVTELLKDNLYEYGKWLRDTGQPPYFTIERLRKIMKQCLEALAFIHSLKLIHCDIKPENILIQSFSQVKVKIIDFGSSCFVTDNLTSYIQSRSYRAPEVILGVPYGPNIDVWSLGCVLAELHTGYVLFQNDSIQAMLARMVGILGPFPEDVLYFGRDVKKYFTSNKVIYHREDDRPGSSVYLLHPKKSSLRRRLKLNIISANENHVGSISANEGLFSANESPSQEESFLSFISRLLELHPEKRPSAEEALRHPWLSQRPQEEEEGPPPDDVIDESEGITEGALRDDT